MHGFFLPPLLTLRLEEALSLKWRRLGVGFWPSFYAWLKLENQKKKKNPTFAIWPTAALPVSRG